MASHRRVLAGYILMNHFLTAATCGGILTNKTGTIVSPDEDQDGIYDADMDCVWLIVAPEEMNVEFEFAFLDIEYIRVCRFDFIEVT